MIAGRSYEWVQLPLLLILIFSTITPALVYVLPESVRTTQPATAVM
jgi:hypothetical protein